MSADSEAVEQVNRPDDCSTQPLLKDVMASPKTPSNDESADVVFGIDDGVDTALPPTDRPVASPVDQKYCIDSTTTPPRLGGDEPMEDIPSTADCSNVTPPKVGFDRGLEPDYIIGATEQNEKLMFLVVWKNSKEADLIEAKDMYDKFPQVAIKFFQDNFVCELPPEFDNIFD